MKKQLFRFAFPALLVAGAGISAQQGSAPRSGTPEQAQPPVTFRAEVNYVEVDARVVDAQGAFVGNLAQSDFEILEDGKPQVVSVFSLVNIPTERLARPLFASRPVEPDVQTNAAGNNGRVYLLVLDDLHTTPLLANRTRAAARQFVERYIGVNDVAAVVHTSGRSDGAQEFTSNQRLLLKAVNVFSGRKLRSALLGRLEAEQLTRGTRDAGDRIDDPDAAERGFQARNTLESLRNFARAMEGVRGRRKALVLFSEGIDYDINDPFVNRDATTIIDATRDAIATATRANVAFYGVDVRGLGAGFDAGIEIQSFPEDTTLGLDSSALQREVRNGQDSLRVLSEQTGGFAVVNNNDIAGAFERLVAENSSYYVLGYYPSNDRRDGRFRKIDVRVTKPGLTVRARRGYVAPRGRVQDAKLAGPNDASAELREAMSSPVPVSGLPLSTTASVFKGPDGKGAVVISTVIGARDLALVEKSGTFNNDLEISVVAVDSKGKLFPGERNTLNLALKPDTVPRVRAAGFRVISAIDLPPGQYQLRIAAREANTRRAGSVLYDVEVPDFSKERIAMSGLALTSMLSSQSLTARPKDPLLKLLPGPLTTVREFPQHDEIAVFAEVYEPAGTPPHKVELALSLNAEGGQSVFQTREERDSSELAGSSGGYGFTARIPLRSIPPGLYVLRLEAQARVADRTTVSRETIVTVTPAPPTGVGGGLAGPLPEQQKDRPTPPPAPPTGTSLPMTTINSDMMSGIDQTTQRVARTAAEWQTLWQQHASGRPVPAVDFARQMVVAVFLGSRTSGGYQVEITGARRDGDALVVQWAERRPAPGQMAAMVMTAPSHIVTLPRHDGPVRFEAAGK